MKSYTPEEKAEKLTAIMQTLHREGCKWTRACTLNGVPAGTAFNWREAAAMRAERERRAREIGRVQQRRNASNRVRHPEACWAGY
jgi:hypothetical protein